MTFANFVKSFEGGRAGLAKALGVTVEAVRLWEAGKRMPRRNHLARIRTLSGGKVKSDDFIDSGVATQ
jgi:DNA-binding transcriptional regulator YiaG